MMRISNLILILYFGLISCSTSDKTNDTSNDSIKSPESKQQNVKPQTGDKLIGTWWNANDKESPTATFEIKDSTIFYPDRDEKSEFKYKIKQDSLVIYFDGFISTSKIEKLKNDTLELITNANTVLLIKK